MNDDHDDRPMDDGAAARAEAARARLERRREADRNEVFNDVYKSADDIRGEWQDAAKKLRLWLSGLVLTGLGGVVLPVLWALSLIAAIGAAMTWETARERKSAYKRALFESDLERNILAHEAAARTGALLQPKPPGEGG